MNLGVDAFPPEIKSLQDWFKKWPPEGREKQWQNGKSAKELAKAWLQHPAKPSVPKILDDLLEACDATRGLQAEYIEGEANVEFDELGRAGQGARQADMRIVARRADNKVILHIEAKSDEKFGMAIDEYWASAVKKTPESNVPKRVCNLCRLLFGLHIAPPLIENLPADIKPLMSQLLYGVASAIIDAHLTGATTAVFIVHELLPNDFSKPFFDESGKARRLLSEKQIAQNAEDLDKFVARLPHKTHTQVRYNDLIDCGTFSPPEDLSWRNISQTKSVRLLIGKIKTETIQL